MARLTYEELGERLGLTSAAARMLARRRRWPTSKGNDGKARVNVADGELESEAERVHERSGGRAPHEAERLQAEVLALTERAAKAEGELVGMRALVDELRRELDRCRLPWWRRWLGR
jgi:hypothetical protein